MKILKNSPFDFLLLIAPLLLALFGVIMVYSSSMVEAVMQYKGSPDLFFKRQLQWFIIGLIAYLFIINVNYRVYLRLRKVIFFGSPLVLVLVLLLGRTAGNATSWLSIGGLGFQPSEFVKLGLIIYLAGVFAKKQSYINQFWIAFGPPVIFTILIFGLVFVQPDLGTALLILFIAGSIIVSAGLKMKQLVMFAICGLVGILLMVPFLTEEQLSRFDAAYKPFAEDQIDDGGYQLVNSYLAIASGGLTGQGLGNSIQKFGYLPEPHTDFIMAIIAEELGIFGVSFVLFFLLCIIVKGYRLAMRHPDPFACLLAIGISSMIGIQAFVNLGALSGLLPVTGVPLPFISYGGSSLFILLISVGILNNIAKNYNKKVVKE